MRIQKIRVKTAKAMNIYFTSGIKILSALGSCHVTIIEDVVDKLSESALINL